MNGSKVVEGKNEEVTTGNGVDDINPATDLETTENSVSANAGMNGIDYSSGVEGQVEEIDSNAETPPTSPRGRSELRTDKDEGSQEGSSSSLNKPPPPPPPNHPLGKPPLPSSFPGPLPKTVRLRSHSMDDVDLAALDLELDDSDAHLDFGMPSSASAGVLEGSERLDRIDTEAGISPELLDALSNPNVDDDTPAAAALRANANVHVSNVSKFARRIKAQNIRRFVKRAALIGKSGHTRGKPPRAPPFRGADNSVIVGGSLPNIYSLEEEDDEISSIDSEPHVENNENRIQSAPPALGGENAAGLPTDTRRPKKHDSPLGGVAEKEHVSFAATEGIPTEVHTTHEHDDDDHYHHHHKLHIGPQFMAWKRRKAKKKKEHRKSYVKGKVIDGQHELYTLSIAVMLGLRTSIGMTNKLMDDSVEKRKPIENRDFTHAEKYIFRPKGGPRTPPHQLSHTFKFKDYSPVIFAYLRRMFGINEFEFLLSVCGNANFIEFISNAKSGQFFFYSYDGKYMIKTMTNAESKFLRQILPHYYRHCAQNPNTLITKFLGMYRVKLYHLRRNVKFVIMNSVFDTDKVIKSLYDLKGSVLGRDAKPHQDVKKDNDFRKGRPDSVIALKPEVRTRLREQVVRDCEFFKKMQIMDYSMLVGVHYIPPKPKFGVEPGPRGIFRDTPGSASGRKRSGRFLHAEDSKGVAKRAVEHSNASDKALHSAGSKDHEHPLGASGMSTPVQKSTKSLRKGSHTTGPSNASVGSDFGMLSDAASMHTLDFVFDEDDENSYLEFANAATTKPPPELTSVTAPSNYHVTKDKNIAGHPPHLFPGCADESNLSTRIEEIELKKEITTQQMFWPYHRFYDIHGRRLMVPRRCSQCMSVECACAGGKEVLDKWGVAPFVPPLSRRKDGGWMMDVEGMKTPFEAKLPNGSTMMCEGKIFYMGIIDILQQYSSRKKVEASFRKYQSTGCHPPPSYSSMDLFTSEWPEASCVHPDVYADRFVAFFDECTQLDPTPPKAPSTAPLFSEKGQVERKIRDVNEEVQNSKLSDVQEEKAEIEASTELSDVGSP